MPLPYGFMLAPDGHIAIDQEKANIVKTIYQQYLSGMSLKGIPSPRGKAQWTQAVISPTSATAAPSLTSMNFS